MFKNKNALWVLVMILALPAAGAADEFMDPVRVSGGVNRYIKRYGDARVDLYINRGDRAPWEQRWSQSDEPHRDYCGPTAGRNLLFWYGRDASYRVLGRDMKTNNWRPGFRLWGACAGVCAGEIAVCANVCYGVLKKFVSRGSLPKHVKSALHRHRPPGFNVYYQDGVGALSRILKPLSDGNPVAVLQSTKRKNLHWTVVTGYFKKRGRLFLRFANGGERTWGEFIKHWSLQKVVRTRAARRVLKRMGIKPYVLLYYSRNGSPWDYTGGFLVRPLTGALVLDLWKRKNPGKSYKFSYVTRRNCRLRGIFRK